METLTEQDLDWLTKAEERLMRMRKREAANTNSRLMIDDLGEMIGKVHALRQWLQSRFDVAVDPELEKNPIDWGDFWKGG